MMGDQIDVWVAGAIVLAFFVGLMIRYLMDLLDKKLGRWIQ